MHDHLRKILHDELDVMLERDEGPNDTEELRLSLRQYSSCGEVEHNSIIDPQHPEITHHAVVARFVKKTVIRKEEGP